MKEANPALTPELVKEVLRLTATHVGNPTYPDLDPYYTRTHGWGNVDALNAVQMALNMRGSDIDRITPELQVQLLNVTAGDEEIVLRGRAWGRTVSATGFRYSLNGFT